MTIQNEFDSYLKNPDQKSFSALYNRLNEASESEVNQFIERLEKIATVANKPILYRNIGYLYQASDRHLEAAFYLNKWLDLKLSIDIEGTERLQYTAVSRHDLRLAAACIDKLEKMGATRETLAVTRARYFMITGHTEHAVSECDFLLKKGVKSVIAAEVILEVAKRNEDARMLSAVLASPSGQYVAGGLGQRPISRIERILRKAIKNIIKQKYGLNT